LLRGALKKQKHALGGEGIGNRALVEAGLGERIHVARECDAEAIIDPLRYAGCGRELRERDAARYGGE
jgi:hypothetical protein